MVRIEDLWASFECNLLLEYVKAADSIILLTKANPGGLVPSIV